MNVTEIEKIINFLYENATNRSNASGKDDVSNPTPQQDKAVALTSVGVMLNITYGSLYVNCFYDGTIKAYRLDFEDDDKQQWDKFIDTYKRHTKKTKSAFTTATPVAFREPTAIEDEAMVIPAVAEPPAPEAITTPAMVQNWLDEEQEVENDKRKHEHASKPKPKEYEKCSECNKALNKKSECKNENCSKYVEDAEEGW